MSDSSENRIGWLKLSADEFAKLLQGKLFYEQLRDAEGLKVLDVKMVGKGGYPQVPLIMIGIAADQLDPMAPDDFVPPTIGWNPKLIP